MKSSFRRHGASGEGEQDSLLSGWNVHQAAEGAVKVASLKGGQQ